MIKLLFVFLFSLSVFAQDDEPQSGVDALKLLFLKMGIESVVTEFDIEKNLTRKNVQEIKELNQRIKEIAAKLDAVLVRLQDAPRVQEKKESPININSSQELSNKIEIDELKKEILSLKELFLSQQPKSIQKPQPPQIIANVIVATSSTPAMDKPNPGAKEIMRFKKGDKLNIEWCNEYKWCKIVGEEQYVAEYVLIPWRKGE